MFDQIGFNRSPFNRAAEQEVVPRGYAVARAVTKPVEAMFGPGPLPTEASGIAIARSAGVATGQVRSIYKALDLSAITIPAGSEVRIDTERMTVMIDGINAIYALSDESRFFDLAKGDTLEINGSGQASITIVWKDRWL